MLIRAPNFIITKISFNVLTKQIFVGQKFSPSKGLYIEFKEIMFNS